jgi:serine/threonine protein phosphatase PrpC
MGQESIKVALGRIELRAGDRLLLCSDGLTNVLDDDRIASICASSNDLVTAVNGLIEQTRAGGAPDNVTAILAEVA